jgi:hypothetical protein
MKVWFSLNVAQWRKTDSLVYQSKDLMFARDLVDW